MTSRRSVIIVEGWGWGWSLETRCSRSGFMRSRLSRCWRQRSSSWWKGYWSWIRIEGSR